MAHPGSASARASAGARADGRPARGSTAVGSTRVRWDRLGRVAMLLVLCVLLYLYISPARSLIGAAAESGRRQAEVAALTRANQQLRAQRDALGTRAAVEAGARSLGLVRPGEREFVISGLPAN